MIGALIAVIIGMGIKSRKSGGGGINLPNIISG
jgi:hypothetical protein